MVNAHTLNLFTAISHVPRFIFDSSDIQILNNIVLHLVLHVLYYLHLAIILGIYSIQTLFDIRHLSVPDQPTGVFSLNFVDSDVSRIQ